MPELIFIRDALTPAERARYYRLRRDGALVAVASGVCVARDDWSRLDPDERYRLTVRAALSRTRGSVVASHASAAALWHLPWLGRWPAVAHATAVGPHPVRSTTNCRMHQRELGHWCEVDGLRATSIERTVVDIAATATFRQAIVVADAAIARGIDRDVLNREVEIIQLRRGSRKVATTLDFASGLSGSPGESLSRLTMSRAGFPAPILQHKFVLPDGRDAFVDFWWPEYGIVGEFDGDGKYLRDKWTSGRTAASIVVDEKWREDGLRSLDLTVVRWGWDVAGSVAALAQKLDRAGLPSRSSSARANFRSF